MDPSEVLKQTKREILKVNKEILTTRKSIEAARNELGSIDREKEMEDSLLEQKVSKERIIQFESFKRDQLLPFNQKVQAAESALESKRLEKGRSLSSIKLEDFHKSSHSIKSLSSLVPILDSVYNKIEEDLGPTFTKSLIDSFPKTKVKLDPESMESLENHFNVRLKQLNGKSMRKSLDSGSAGQSLDRVFRKVMGGSNKVQVLGTGTALIGLGLVFLAPVYLPYTIYQSVKKLNNIKLYRDLLYDHTIIHNNIDRLVNNSKILADKQYKQEIEKVTQTYDNEIKDLESKSQDAKVALRRKELSIEGEFRFSDEELHQSHAVRISSFASKKDKISSLIAESEKKLIPLEKELIRLNDGLVKTLEDIKNQYMGRTYDKYTVPERILLDVSDKGVDLLENKTGSSIVFCDSKQSMNNFSSLWMYQIKAQMHPFAYKILLVDTKAMGLYHAQFFGESNTCFLYDTPDKISEVLGDLQSAGRHRIKYCTTEFKTLEEYNNAMRAAGSIVESYRLVFILDPPASLFSDASFISLLSTGREVGIYIIIMMETQDVKEDCMDLFRYIDNFYTLEDNSATKLAEHMAYTFVQTAIGKPPNDN